MNKQVTILLVDDDFDDTSLFEEVLNEVSPSTSLIKTTNGMEALNLLKNNNIKPDIIFLDLNMPRMGGKECLKELKNDPDLNYIPVIIYTTSSHSRDIEEALMNGATCFITKPVNVKDLKDILFSVLQGLPSNLQKVIRHLSNYSKAFIVC